MTITDEQLRRTLEERVRAAGAHDAPALSTLARTITLATPRPAMTRWRFGMRWMAIPAAVLVAAIAFAVVPGTRPAPLASEPPVASAVQATAVAPSATDLPEPTPTPTPSQASLVIDGCADLGFDAQRCRAVVARAAGSLEPPVSLDEIVRAAVSPPGEPTVTRTMEAIASVLLSVRGRPDTSVEVFCGPPGPSDRACNADARIIASGGISTDVPCGPGPGGEPGSTCATPVPTPRPASVAAARPLRLAKHTVLFDHLGHYEIYLGDAGLPDGAIREISFAIADPQPTTYWIDGPVWLDVRPDDPTRPPVGSVFRKPFKGVELVHVYLVFDVSEIDADSTLEATDIVVR